MTREQAYDLIHERLYKLSDYWLYFMAALILDKEKEQRNERE